MDKLNNIRNNFIRMRGGKLILAESIILAFVIFFILTVVKDVPQYLALIIAFVVGFVFPILVGIFKSLAWLVAILFSLVWAFLGIAFFTEITGGSVLIGLLAGIILFAVSFKKHRNYSGLSIQRVSQIKNNNNSVTNTDNYITKEMVEFCPNCGRRIINGICDVCNNREE